MQNNKFNPRTKLIRNNQKFSQQEVTFDDTPLFFPKGLEKIFLLFYFITLPYLTGLAFLFFYVGSGDSSLFASLSHDASYLLTWIIGYEILAVITLLWILKKAIEFTIENSTNSTVIDNNFRRP